MNDIRLEYNEQLKDGVISFEITRGTGILAVENDEIARRWLELDKTLAHVTNALINNGEKKYHPILSKGYHLNGQATFRTNQPHAMGLLLGHGLFEPEKQPNYKIETESTRKQDSVVTTSNGLKVNLYTLTSGVFRKSTDGLTSRNLTHDQIKTILGPLQREFMKQRGGKGY